MNGTGDSEGAGRRDLISLKEDVKALVSEQGQYLRKEAHSI